MLSRMLSDLSSWPSRSPSSLILSSFRISNLAANSLKGVISILISPNAYSASCASLNLSLISFFSSSISLSIRSFSTLFLKLAKKLSIYSFRFSCSDSIYFWASLYLIFNFNDLIASLYSVCSFYLSALFSRSLYSCLKASYRASSRSFVLSLTYLFQFFNIWCLLSNCRCFYNFVNFKPSCKLCACN